MLYLVLIWPFLFVVCLGLAIAVLVRRGSAGAAHAVAMLVGGVLTAGFVSGALGLAEGVYRPLSTGFLVSILIGGAGVAGIAWGGRGLRKPVREGSCSACGYDLTGSIPGAPCPECGTAPSSAGEG